MIPDIDALNAALMQQDEAAVELLRELVAIDTPSGDVEGLNLALDVVERELSRRGFSIERVADDAGTPFLVADRGEGNPFGLLAHLDTVFARGEAERRPFARDGDIATGPGVADMKGGIVTALRCVDLLDAMGDAPALRFVVNGDEERGSPGSRRLLVEALRDARAVLVFEPGRPGGEFVIGRRGTVRVRLKVAGVASHSGVAPRDGANAIHDLAVRIAKIAQLGPDFPECDLNVNLVSGGIGINTIPDAAEAEVDVRTTSEADDAAIRRRIVEIAEAAGVSRTRCSIEWLASRPPLEQHARQRPIAEAFVEAGERLSLPVELITTGGGSDGNLLAAEGVSVIDGCGPVGGGYHREDEFVRLSTLTQRAAICAAGLRILMSAVGS